MDRVNCERARGSDGGCPEPGKQGVLRLLSNWGRWLLDAVLDQTNVFDPNLPSPWGSACVTRFRSVTSLWECSKFHEARAPRADRKTYKTTNPISIWGISPIFSLHGAPLA